MRRGPCGVHDVDGEVGEEMMLRLPQVRVRGHLGEHREVLHDQVVKEDDVI